MNDVEPNISQDNLSKFVPHSELCKEALDLAYSSLPTPIFNHSFRVFLHAKHLAHQEASSWSDEARLPLLFVACILHDIGCSSLFGGPQRFEVAGADASTMLLSKHALNQDDIHQVWTAIALHTSPGIAERISPLARLVREAVLLDFGKGAEVEEVARRKVDMESQLPRLEIEKVLGDTVVEQAMACPEKAPPSSWPGILLKAKMEDPHWQGVNKAF